MFIRQKNNNKWTLGLCSGGWGLYPTAICAPFGHMCMTLTQSIAEVKGNVWLDKSNLWLCDDNRWRITKIILIFLVGNMNDCIKCHGDPSNSCWNISVWSDQLTDGHCHPLNLVWLKVKQIHIYDKILRAEIRDIFMSVSPVLIFCTLIIFYFLHLHLWPPQHCVTIQKEGFILYFYSPLVWESPRHTEPSTWTGKQSWDGQVEGVVAG